MLLRARSYLHEQQAVSKAADALQLQLSLDRRGAVVLTLHVETVQRKRPQRSELRFGEIVGEAKDESQSLILEDARGRLRFQYQEIDTRLAQLRWLIGFDLGSDQPAGPSVAGLGCRS